MSEDDLTNESIGERLRRLRVERGLSQRDIAGDGVSFTYVSRIESGQRQPSIKALRVLARTLGVTADYLETGRDVPAATEFELRLGDAELEVRLGDAETAEQRFRALVAQADETLDSDEADRARIGLALALTHQGRNTEASELLERALDATRTSVTERPDLYATLGRAYAAAGETPRAVALFRRCLEEIEQERRPDAVLAVRFATYLSYALTDVGDTAAAHHALVAAVGHAEGVHDRTTLVRLYWSLARYYAFEGPPARAVDYIRKAIALLETGEDTFYLARAHESCASLLLDQGDATDARGHLDTAEELYLGLAEPAFVGSVRAERARLGLLSGDVEAARTDALEALDLLDRGGEQVEVSRAWRTLGDVLDRLGEPELSDRAYSTAVEQLVAQGAGKELAETYRAYGKFLRAHGRESDALDVYERAADLAARTVVVPHAAQSERNLLPD